MSMKTRRQRVSFGPIMLMCTIVGCAARTGRAAGPRGERQIIVRVENAAFTDFRVYAVVNEGNRTRLGAVGSLTTRTMSLPRALSGTGTLRLMATPLAAGDSRATNLIRVQPGDTVVWQIGNGIAAVHIRH